MGYRIDKASFSEIVKVIEVLIKAGAKVNGIDKETIKLLSRSCERGLLEVIKFFVTHGADYTRFIDTDSDQAVPIDFPVVSPLYSAVQSGKCEVVKYLVKTLKVDVEQMKNQWPSPIYYAINVLGVEIRRK